MQPDADVSSGQCNLTIFHKVARMHHDLHATPSKPVDIVIS